MTTLKTIRSVGALLMATFVLGLASGCFSPDPENKSAQPWNKQRPWEHGIPGGLTERR